MAVFVLGVFAVLLQFGFAVQAFQLRRDEFRAETLITSLIASVPHWASLLTYFIVFGLGGSSNVAQLAGPAGFSYWSIWTSMWPLLCLGSFGGGIVIVIMCVAPPYPNGQATDLLSFFSRWCGLFVAGCAMFILTTYFPDA